MNNKSNSNQHSQDTDLDTLQSDIPVYSGPIVGATLSALLGFLTLVISHHVSRLTKGLDQTIHAYGHWIPGSTGTGPDGSIGSYSGKETLALFVWFTTWLIFHCLWRKQDFSLRALTPLLIGTLFFLMLGLFHPLIDPVVLFIAGLFGYASP
ncbi:hypothetical protein [Crenothrix sp.]|uniref:hypothetical protein n=1 Tax=Crenothrix sp. TaxID=3100433 RepID=UPI00374D9D9F